MHDVRASKRNQFSQGASFGTTGPPVSTLPLVAEKRSEREIPQAWRDSVADHLERWIALQPKVRGRAPSERALAPLLGISPFSLNRLRLKKGPMGIHVLIAISRPLELTLDELLGLKLNVDVIRRILREELAAASDRDKSAPALSPQKRVTR